MAERQNSNQKQPSEKEEPGPLHYNPGNMAGKPVESGKAKAEPQADADTGQSDHEQH
jgi:hypothetical protein